MFNDEANRRRMMSEAKNEASEFSVLLYGIAAAMNNELAAQSPMAAGKTVQTPDGRTVKIQSGQYLSNGRVSNFWYWREVLPDGDLGPEECGYGW